MVEVWDRGSGEPFRRLTIFPGSQCRRPGPDKARYTKSTSSHTYEELDVHPFCDLACDAGAGRVRASTGSGSDPLRILDQTIKLHFFWHPRLLRIKRPDSSRLAPRAFFRILILHLVLLYVVV